MPGDVTSPTDRDELLRRYTELGLRLVYWQRQGTDPRGWKGPRDAGWNDPDRAYPLDRFDRSMNIGLITGHEVAPGRFVADVDLDWAPGVEMAGKLLPSTGFAFGRAGKKISHAIFTTPERFALIKHCDFGEGGKGDGETFIEVRSGDSSHQTMIAPSLHSPGVEIKLVLSGQILHVETARLAMAAFDYAVACLLLKHVKGGLHHAGRQALAGFLMRAGLSPERTTAIGEAVCQVQASMRVPEMTSADVTDMGLVVRSTLKRIDSGKRVEGGPTLSEFIGDEAGKQVVIRINRWLGREDDFIRNSAGQIVAKNQENIERAVGLLGHTLSFDEFAATRMIDGKPMDDQAVETMLSAIEKQHRFQPPEQYFERIVRVMAWQRPYHPVKQYLATLTWDQTPRIDEWLIEAGGAEATAYVRAIGAIMLIAAVRRIRQPGCKYDEMVVWESPQGSFKSSAAQALCPNPDWFSDDLRLNLHSQQLIEATLGKWIVEASDLAGKRKTEIEQLKAMLSRQVDGPARMAYAHFPVQRPRHFIIIGTTNSSAYLTDSTGGRRFWPIVVTQFNVPWIVKHRDQLWAEACVREATGESIRLAEELWPVANTEQEKRREMDPWEDVLRRALSAMAPHGDERRRVTTSAVWDILNIPSERRDRSGALRISEVMQRFGFQRTRVRSDGGEVQVGYVQHDLSQLALADDGVLRVPGEDDETILRAPRKDDEVTPF